MWTPVVTSPAPPAGPGDAGPGLPDPRFLTIAEVARLMRISKMTVYRLVHSGELPAARIGRTLRVTEQAVRDYLRSAVVTGAAADGQET